MKEKGITMLALVITIIVLLILASISLIGLTGEEGLLKKANNASEEAKISKYQEELETIDKRMELKRIKKQVSSEKYMERYKEEIEKNEVFKDANVTLENANTIKLITKEGYIFIITRNEIKYIGKENGEDNTVGDNEIEGDIGTVPPDLKQSDIELIPSPSKLTNTDVTVQINVKISGYTIQYSKTGTSESDWKDYKSPIVMQQNGPIYVRLWSGTKAGGYTTGNILNIDKIKPVIGNISETSATGRIIATNVVDEGVGGLAGYYVSTTNTTPDVNANGWIPLSKDNFGHSVKEIGTYYVWVKDNAGNMSDVKSCTITEIPIRPNENDEEVKGTTFSTEYGKIDVIWLKDDTKEVVSSPNAPVLTSGGESMTPIKWNTSNNIVPTTNTDSNWYNYGQNEWANARTANESYFVWIPRYAYRITYYASQTSTTPTGYYDGYGQWRATDGALRLKLDEGVNTVDYNGEKYIVHPAFDDNIDMGGWSNKLPGFWFAKFEISRETENDLKSIYGVQSTVGISTIGGQYTASITATYGYIGTNIDKEAGKNVDGTEIYSGKKSYMNSHMTKNSEWGAVAYLAHSAYGRNGKEISINLNEDGYTGGGEDVAYLTNTNQSTTGNVYGIYDMSGGLFESISGFNSVDKNNRFEELGWTEATGLTTESSSTKYATKYNNPSLIGAGNNIIYNCGKIGDATKEVNTGGKYNKDQATDELKSWFANIGQITSSGTPFFINGGSHFDTTPKGIFCVQRFNGSVYNNFGFRTVLTPND